MLAFRLLRAARTHTPTGRTTPEQTHAANVPFRYNTDSSTTMKFLALIADLRRPVQIFDHHIHQEEKRTGVFDVSKIAYPILAANLRARRDNLLATITMLKTQLAESWPKWIWLASECPIASSTEWTRRILRAP
jgi:hypothetical protein